jgi:hypothetical protein
MRVSESDNARHSGMTGMKALAAAQALSAKGTAGT